jgi:hypothetical protein
LRRPDRDADGDRHRLDDDLPDGLLRGRVEAHAAQEEEDDGRDGDADAHLLDRVDDDLLEAGVVAQARVVVVAEEQHEGRDHVGGQPPRVRREARPPDLHRVEQRQAEQQAPRHAARVLPERLGFRPHSCVTAPKNILNARPRGN